jgi:hypothetical protein
MISLFQSASEKDVEQFASRLRDGLKAKFSFVIGQSKLLHLLAELNGFKNWQSFKIGLSRNVPQYVLDFLRDEEGYEPDDILDAEEIDGVVYVAFRRLDGNVHAGVLFPRDEGWYKFRWDAEGPTAEECPVRILDQLSPTDDEWANEWRDRCRVIASRKGNFESDNLPYRQLFYLAVPIDVDGKKVEYFVRSTPDTFEGIDRHGSRVTFSFDELSDRTNLDNIGFTAVPEFRNNYVSINEFMPGGGPIGTVILRSLGGKQPVDVLMAHDGRIVSWCGYGDNLRGRYGAQAERGLFGYSDGEV